MFFSILSHSFFNGTQISFPYIVVAHLSNSNNDGDNDIAKRSCHFRRGSLRVRNLQGLEMLHGSKISFFFLCHTNRLLWRQTYREYITEHLNNVCTSTQQNNGRPLLHWHCVGAHRRCMVSFSKCRQVFSCRQCLKELNKSC